MHATLLFAVVVVVVGLLGVPALMRVALLASRAFAPSFTPNCAGKHEQAMELYQDVLARIDPGDVRALTVSCNPLLAQHQLPARALAPPRLPVMIATLYHRPDPRRWGWGGHCPPFLPSLLHNSFAYI